MHRDLVRRFLEADVKCYLCGMPAGTLRREDGVRGARPVFRDGSGRSEAVGSLAGLRCAHCRGSLYADEVELVYEYSVDALAEDRPRRGRPPKLKSA